MIKNGLRKIKNQLNMGIFVRQHDNIIKNKLK